MNYNLSIHDESIGAFNFPAGEMHVKINNDVLNTSAVNLLWEWRGHDDIIRFLLITNALKKARVKINSLHIPYFPFAPQDRINVRGEPLSVEVMANVVNQAQAERVYVTDPHSDVVAALVNNIVVVYQHEVFADYFRNRTGFVLVSPDGGALKKIYKLANIVGPCDVLECSKIRNVMDGSLGEARINNWKDEYADKELIIVDDICFGGLTFINIAKKLKELSRRFDKTTSDSYEDKYAKVTLMVTHGFFNKGLQVFDGLIDRIYTRKGFVK